MFKKTIIFSDTRPKKAAELEVELQTIASRYSFSPKILHTEFTDTECHITMTKLGMCLADTYGDNPKDIPKHFWGQLQSIVQTLYEVEGIEYVDITPYNFIEQDGKLYVIDFGDALYTKGKETTNWFLKEFLQEPYGWNPDFA